MAKLNIILFTFILITWSVFKALMFANPMISGIEGAFIGFEQDCPGNVLIHNKNVCINFAEFGNITDVCTFRSVGSFDIVSATQNVACAIRIGIQAIYVTVKVVFELILAIFAIIIDIVLLFGLYIALGISPIPGAPLPINAILVLPFILVNFVLVISFFTGD
jgi:hypothetical protein